VKLEAYFFGLYTLSVEYLSHSFLVTVLNINFYTTLSPRSTHRVHTKHVRLFVHCIQIHTIQTVLSSINAEHIHNSSDECCPFDHCVGRNSTSLVY